MLTQARGHGTMRLDGRVALITGGTSGIGKATAELFAREGARVAITGRNESRGQAVVTDIAHADGSAIFIAADVRQAADCRHSVEATMSAFGQIDVLFNNAGVFFPATVPDCTEEEWDDTIDVSLKGAFLMSKYTLPVMIAQQRGVVILNSSGWGLVGGALGAAYCAAKGGLIVMAKAMAIDHARQGIRVNCICPGDIETPMLDDDAKKRGMELGAYLATCADRPMGRVGRPDEIAKSVLFLASDDSSFMTGAALVVDGGGVAD
jgi:NAD(P)-dependent dehydrogenase (short-subunit alcohol dehydrogenase family)